MGRKINLIDLSKVRKDTGVRYDYSIFDPNDGLSMADQELVIHTIRLGKYEEMKKEEIQNSILGSLLISPYVIKYWDSVA